MRLLILAGLLSLPVLWFGPPWAGSGQPFLAATHASEYNGHLGSDPFRAVIGRGIDEQVLPALIAAIIAVANRLVAPSATSWWLALGAGVVAWWIVVIAMTLDGYPGLERFFLPAAALTCVLGGVGITWLAQLAGSAAGRHATVVTVAWRPSSWSPSASR